MEGDIENQKIGFFGRIKLAIFKLEDYGMFLGERLSVAIKYFFLLLLLVTVITAIASTYDYSRMIDKVNNYVQNELPDFSYENGKLNFSEKVDAYDNDYEFTLIAYTQEEISEDVIKEYKNRTTFGVILLQNKAILISNGTEIEKEYSELQENLGITVANKSDIINQLTPNNINTVIGTCFATEVIISYLINITEVFFDICVLTIFGWIASRFCGVSLKWIPVIQLAIYSITLSVILKCIYSVSYVFTSFYIEYFDVIYLLISYVYMIAAIFMVKYDLIKHNEELQKILEVQLQVRQEVEDENKEEDKENKKEDEEKKDNDSSEEPEIENNREPDGSEI